MSGNEAIYEMKYFHKDASVLLFASGIGLQLVQLSILMKLSYYLPPVLY